MVDVRGAVKPTSAGSPPANAARDERRTRRRAELLDAAIAAIDDQGHDVSMDDIAQRAGVSKPILYRHFGDKAGLYTAVSEVATERLRAAMLTDLDPAADPRSLIHTVIDAYLTFIAERPELYRFVVRRSFPDRPVQSDPVTTHKDLVAGVLTTLFRDRLDALGLPSDGAETWAHAGVGMVQAAGEWWLERQTLPRDAVRDHLVTLACAAIATLLDPASNPDGPDAEAEQVS